MAVDESEFRFFLGLSDDWSITDVDSDHTDKIVRIAVGTPRGKMFPCPECGKMCSAHDFQPRTWRGLDMGEYKCEISARLPRTACPECGIKTVSPEWTRPYSRFTLNFERRCLDLVGDMPVASAAGYMGISDDTLWNMLTHFVDISMKGVDMSSVRKVGVDETSCRRGHDYISIFIDLDSHKVLFAVPGRGSSVIGSFREYLEKHNGKASCITDFSCDMSPSFISGISESFPSADITFDKFHVMKIVGEAVDTVRRSESAKNRVAIGMRYALLKDPKNLSAIQKEEVDNILKENRNIMFAYGFKESMRVMFSLPNPDYARRHLATLLLLAEADDSPVPVRNAAATIRRHFEGILRWHLSELTNAVLEGTNSVIQAVKRMARGYKHPENMISMLYIRSAGIRI
jgi:transposase